MNKLFGLLASSNLLGQNEHNPTSDLITAEEFQFFKYIAEYGKTYGTKAEYNFRLNLFSQRLAMVEEFNSRNGETSTIGINKFSDWTNEEIRRLMGLKEQETKVEPRFKEFDTEGIASNIDWRELGGVTPVKNQGHCGSCWSFSTTGAMEGAHFAATGELLSLSESNLVDCSWLNHGCNGGLMDLAFMYAESHPLETEADYPYTPSTGIFACKYDKKKGKVAVKTYHDVPRDSAAQLKAALNVAPVSIGIQADQPVFHYYTGGIITSADCGTTIDHGVLAVGYGVENGQEYYIVKNSWGSDWGENGFVRIGVKDGEGICGIHKQASQPTTN
jgi:C1A family cysteine protease